MNSSELYKFLTSRRLGVLSSISSNGSPQSALVGFAITDGLEIVFDTLDSTRKYRNLHQNPSVSFVIGWEEERTVQFEGIASELEGSDLELYQPIYFAAWPECRSHAAWAGITWFVVRPRWIRYSDYAQNPPLIEEFSF